MRLNLIALLVVLVATGCTTTPKSTIPQTPRSFPADALITQRAVLTARGRQFTLNGYLATSATNGRRLIVTENMGAVLADVLVKPDGAVQVMRSSKIFRKSWIEHFVAADLQCIMGNSSDCPGQMVSPNHFLIQRYWYSLDLQIVDTKPGLQSPELFDGTKGSAP